MVSAAIDYIQHMKYKKPWTRQCFLVDVMGNQQYNNRMKYDNISLNLSNEVVSSESKSLSFSSHTKNSSEWAPVIEENVWDPEKFWVNHNRVNSPKLRGIPRHLIVLPGLGGHQFGYLITGYIWD